MINLLIKNKKLEFRKNKGRLTIQVGMFAKPNKSRQSTFKEWNKKWQKK